MASLLLAALIGIGMGMADSPFSLIAYLVCFARVAIFACNYILIYEALQSWLPVPLLGAYSLRRTIASDSELLFLLSCALYAAWEVTDITGLAKGSNTTLAIVAGIGLGGGALARTFGASLLLWARNAALRDQTTEERKLRVMLTNWYVPPGASVDSADGLKAAPNGSQQSTPAPEKGARAAHQRYLDASAVSTRLMAPDTLPRALSLQNLASCGAVLGMLLDVARQVKQRSCKLDIYLVHMVRSSSLSCCRGPSTHLRDLSRARPS